MGLESAGDDEDTQRIAEISDRHGNRMDIRLLELSAVAYQKLLGDSPSEEERARLLNNLVSRLTNQVQL